MQVALHCGTRCFLGVVNGVVGQVDVEALVQWVVVDDAYGPCGKHVGIVLAKKRGVCYTKVFTFGIYKVLGEHA